MRIYRNLLKKFDCKAIQFDGSISLCEKYGISKTKLSPMVISYSVADYKGEQNEIYDGCWIVERVENGILYTEFLSNLNFKRQYVEVK